MQWKERTVGLETEGDRWNPINILQEIAVLFLIREQVIARLRELPYVQRTDQPCPENLHKLLLGGFLQGTDDSAQNVSKAHSARFNDIALNKGDELVDVGRECPQS